MARKRKKDKDTDQPELPAAGAGDQDKPDDKPKPKPSAVAEAAIAVLKGEDALKDTVLNSLKSFYKGIVKSQELDTFMEEQATLWTRLAWKASNEKDKRKAEIFKENLKEIIAQGKGKAHTLRVAIEVKLQAADALKAVGEFLFGLVKAKLL